MKIRHGIALSAASALFACVGIAQAQITIPFVVGQGPSEEQIAKAARDQAGRKEAATHETPILTGLKKGDVLQFKLITGEVTQKTYKVSFSEGPIVRLRIDRMAVIDSVLGVLDCGIFARDTFHQKKNSGELLKVSDKFLYCKPQQPAGAPVMTSAWEPYFVPDEPKTTGWGKPIQIEPVVLPLEPAQYNRYLILRVDHFDVRNDAGQLYRCTLDPNMTNPAGRGQECSPVGKD